MATETIALEIIAKTTQAEAGLKRVGATAEAELGAGGKVDKAAKHGGGALGMMDKASGGLLGGLTSLESPTTALIAGSAALVGVGTEVFAAFNKNEDQMHTLSQAMKDAGEKETPAFTKSLSAAQVAGENMGFAQADVTASIGQLRLAGVSTADGMKYQNTIMDLARAKGLSLADATNVVIKADQGKLKGLVTLGVVAPQGALTQTQLAAATLNAAKTSDAAGKAFDAYGAAAKKYGDNAPQTIAAHTKYTAAVKAADDAQKKLSDGQKTTVGSASYLGNIMDQLGGKIGGQATSHTQDLGVKIDVLKSRFNDIAGHAIPFIGQAFGNVLTFLMGPFASTIGTIVGIIAGIVGRIVAVIGSIVTWIKGHIGVVVFLIAGPFGLAVLFIATHMAGVIAVFRGVFSVIAAIVGTIINIFKVPFDIVTTIIGVFVGVVSGIIGGLVSVIGGAFGVLPHAVQLVVNIISGIFSTVAAVIKGIWQGLSDGIGTIFTAIGNIVKAPINAVITLIDGIITLIDKLQIHIPAIGVGPIHTPSFDWNGLNIGQIPHLSVGGDVAPGGYAWTGEAGPELMRWGGATPVTVIPAARSAAMAGQAGGATVVNVTAQTNADPDAIGRAVVWGLSMRARKVATA